MKDQRIRFTVGLGVAVVVAFTAGAAVSTTAS